MFEAVQQFSSRTIHQPDCRGFICRSISIFIVQRAAAAATAAEVVIAAAAAAIATTYAVAAIQRSVSRICPSDSFVIHSKHAHTRRIALNIFSQSNNDCEQNNNRNCLSLKILRECHYFKLNI